MSAIKTPSPGAGGPPLHHSESSVNISAADRRDSAGAGSPANEISEEGFSSLFQHVIHTSRANFEEQALEGNAIPTASFADHAVNFAGNEAELQMSLAEWLNGLEHLSTTTELRSEIPRKSAAQPDQLQKSSEASMASTIFVNYGEIMRDIERSDGRDWRPYPRDPRGCLVTVGSRQEITACLNAQTNILFQGECKHGDYRHMHGIRQCAGYLYHQLWWFRTVQGIYIERVYGFVVCGPKCKDVPPQRVNVSLLVLCAPEAKIGSPLKLYEYKEECDIRDPKLFNTLGNFVTANWRQGLRWDDPAINIPTSACYPGCMMIPSAFLQRYEGQVTWQIVPSRNAALVIRLNVQNRDMALRFVEKLNLEMRQNRKARGVVVKANQEGRGNVYVKMKTYASGTHWESAALVAAKALFDDLDQEEKQEIQAWRDVYPTGGFFSSHNHALYMMHDMGCPFGALDPAAEAPNHGYFCIEYAAMMEETLKVQEYTDLVHGDIHHGNLVYKHEAEPGKRLRLIDWDEAEQKRPMKRKAKTNLEKERYPTELQTEPLKYTKAQLILLFRDISRRNYEVHVFLDKGEMQCRKLKRGDQKLAVTAENVDHVYSLLSKYLLVTHRRGGMANKFIALVLTGASPVLCELSGCEAKSA